MSSKIKISASQLVNLLGFTDKLKKLQQTRDKVCKIPDKKFYGRFEFGNGDNYRETGKVSLDKPAFLAMVDAQITTLISEFNKGQTDLEVENSDLDTSVFPALTMHGDDED